MHEVQRRGVRPVRHEVITTFDEAFELLDHYGVAAKPIAGGSDLLLQLARGEHRDVSVLVDLSGIAGHDQITIEQGTIEVGPLVTHNQVIRSALAIESALPLAQACLEVGAPALRNRATVVGNLVTASPANDTISALWALDATVLIGSLHARREVPVRQFYPGIRATALKPGELVLGIRIPTLGGTARGVFVKLGQRRAQAISVVHVAVVLDIDNGAVTRASVALGSVGPTIVSAAQAEDFLLGRFLTADTIAKAAELAATSVTPISDLRGTAEYRLSEVAVLVHRALKALSENQERVCWPSRPVRLHPGDATHRKAERATIDVATEVVCQVNGVGVRQANAVGVTLLDWLREEVGLTGTKEGCAEGECGACTVHLDGMAVLSCLVPAARAHGSDVTTIEGLAATDGTLNGLQQSFVDNFAVQCGYCIPGFVMAADRLLAECPNPTDADIAQGLSGNLCRCTGYYRFYEALRGASMTQSPVVVAQ